ncbi:hypothetical protein CN128_09835 [Sinorhizobium meliloti]|uniref:hypothetical protein n=1 Tax=Rhizobium meliloti TaxID=382 RepID=UPI000FD80C72|nr:hypothetical protein [Sinorhizobium meliloti]RVM58383.1 hypothetical protein CN128_09835 [Sinorhizobium meliloti]
MTSTNPPAAEVRGALDEMARPLKRAHVVPFLRQLLSEAAKEEIDRLYRILRRYTEDHLPGYLRSWMTTLVSGWPERFPAIHAADVALDGILSASLLSLADGRRVPWYMVHGSYSWIDELRLGRPNAVSLRIRAAAIINHCGHRLSADEELAAALPETSFGGEYESRRQKRDMAKLAHQSPATPRVDSDLKRFTDLEWRAREDDQRRRYEQRISALTGRRFEAQGRPEPELKGILREAYFDAYPERFGQPLWRHDLWGWENDPLLTPRFFGVLLPVPEKGDRHAADRHPSPDRRSPSAGDRN